MTWSLLWRDYLFSSLYHSYTVRTLNINFSTSQIPVTSLPQPHLHLKSTSRKNITHKIRHTAMTSPFIFQAAFIFEYNIQHKRRRFQHLDRISHISFNLFRATSYQNKHTLDFLSKHIFSTYKHLIPIPVISSRWFFIADSQHESWDSRKQDRE